MKTIMGFIPDSKEERQYEERVKTLRIHKDAINLHGFDMELLKNYPHKLAAGDVPVFLLKPSDDKDKLEPTGHKFRIYS